MKFLFSLFVTFAGAFTIQKPSTSFRFAGDTKPLGYFDPLQITKNSKEDTIKYLREAELQHSRTAMVAAVVFPIIEIATKEPAINVLSERSQAAQIAWLTAFSVYELARMNAGWENPFNGGKPFRLEDSYEPGSVFLRSNAQFFKNVDDSGSDETDRRLNVELNNGRLAMLGIGGTMLQELVTGHGTYLDLLQF